MLSFLSLCRSRPMPLLGACALVLTQAACAHPVAFDPAVVVQAQIGGPVHAAVHVPAYPLLYGPHYQPHYGPPPVMVSPPPMRVAPPLWVWGAPSPFVPARPWVHPEHRHKPWVGAVPGRRGGGQGHR